MKKLITIALLSFCSNLFAEGGFVSTVNKVEVQDTSIVIFYDSPYTSFPGCDTQTMANVPIDDIRADKMLSLALAAVTANKKLHFTVYGCDQSTGMHTIKYLAYAKD